MAPNVTGHLIYELTSLQILGAFIWNLVNLKAKVKNQINFKSSASNDITEKDGTPSCPDLDERRDLSQTDPPANGLFL